MEKITSFDISVFGLLQEYPLYDYRIREGKEYRLPVLLIGRGAHLDQLRDKVLSNGQLLDTRLEVTVITEDPAASLEVLGTSAPDLGRFIEIRGTGRTPEWHCGTLTFEQQPRIEENLASILAGSSGYPYVLISLETDADVPAFITPGPGQLIAWVKGDTIRVCGARRRVFRPDRNDKAMQEILDIAYRLHYAYEKGNDPHITNREIRANFNKSYNYLANIECALHVRSKLKCADIDPTALNSAGEEFARKMAADTRSNGDLLERLAQLEHRRWCVSKFTGKRRTPESLHVIYGDDGSTTRSKDESVKWHVALVPYGKDGALCRHLSEQDWSAEDPEAIGDLDELDKQTLRIHKRCGEITNRKLELARAHMEQLKKELPEKLRNHIDQMEKARQAMALGDRNAVFVYRYHFRNLDQQFDDEHPVKELLKALDKDMGAPIEYLTRKDYKKQNLVLVGSIPFALCGWKSTVLVKLMAESVHECVAAAWQLEPGHVLFVDTAENLEELRQLSRKAQQIDRFLSRNCNQVQPSYHVFVPEKTRCFPDTYCEAGQAAVCLEDIRKYDPGFFGNSDWALYPVSDLSADDLRPRFVEMMHASGATSIDMTGGKPVLVSLADGYARNNRAGAFFIRDNRIRNFYGARGMELQALDKGLSVQQLFDQTDAELIKRDDDEISAVFLAKCGAMWEIAHAHAENWYRFCMCFAKTYRDQPGTLDPNGALQVPVKDLHQRMEREYGANRQEFEKILDQLVDAGLLRQVSRRMFYEAASEEVIACLRNSGKILEYYLYCTVKNSPVFQDEVMSWMFRHAPGAESAKNEVDVICMVKESDDPAGVNTPLFISAKNITPDSLNKNNFLNYICYEVGWLADRFGGLRPKTILAAPNVKQFENGKPSRLVQKAMSRGVYLLGDRCFRDGNLTRVLESIARGRGDWCECLLKTAVTV